MTGHNALPPLALAEELSISELETVFADRAALVLDFPNDDLENDFSLGGLRLDMALHPDTDADLADEYFEDAQIYWQRVIDNPYTSPKTLDARVGTELLLAHMPAFRARKADEELHPDDWDDIDFQSAVILDEFLAKPDVYYEDKNIIQAARIGTQLLCGVAGIQTYPSTGRESLKGEHEATLEQRELGHSLYAIRDAGKVPLQVRLRHSHLRAADATHVRIPFGDLAQNSLRAVAPDLAEDYPKRAQCAAAVANWLISVAKDDEVPSHATAIIDRMADNLVARIDTYKTTRNSSNL